MIACVVLKDGPHTTGEGTVHVICHGYCTWSYTRVTCVSMCVHVCMYVCGVPLCAIIIMLFLSLRSHVAPM